jgi:hypothetical protein
LSAIAAPTADWLDSLIVDEFPPLFEEFRAKQFTLLYRGSRNSFIITATATQTPIPGMPGPLRTARPAEQPILDPACRHYFSLPVGIREQLACTAEASTRVADCGRDWSIRRVPAWLNHNSDRSGTPGAGRSLW